MKTGDLLYLTDTYLPELDSLEGRPWSVHPTGLAEVDRLLDGGYQAGLHVIGGLTGVGKTAFALALAFKSAIEGRNVLFLSLEQSKRELWSRVIASRTGIAYSDLKRGGCRQGTVESPLSNRLRSAREWGDIEAAAERLEIIEAGDALSATGHGDEVEHLCGPAKSIARSTGAPPLVVVDYLQRVPLGDHRNRDTRERVGRVVGLLQVKLARELSVPVLALSSINREAYHPKPTGDSMVSQLASLKEAGEIEYTSSTVAILATSPRDGGSSRGIEPGSPQVRSVDFSLVKNRDGITGSISLNWDPVPNEWSPASVKDPFNHGRRVAMR